MQDARTAELSQAVGTEELSSIQKFSVGFARWSHKWIPNSLVFVILLTGVAALLAYALTPSSPWQVVLAWENGFWDLLAFAMQMCLAMTTGFVVADSPFVKKWLFRLAALPNNASQAIVMLTADDAESTIERAREHGADGYLVKPVSPIQVLGLLDTFDAWRLDDRRPVPRFWPGSAVGH